MFNLKNILRIGLMASITTALLLTSCRPPKNQTQLLHDLNIDGVEQFSSLPPCKQIEIYSIIGSEYLDVDHMIALVPKWMNDEISKIPPDVTASCIAEQGQNLLSHWGDDPGQYEKNSFKIHALIYKAIDLNLLAYPDIENLVSRTLCETSVFAKERLDIFFYIKKHPNLTNYPDASEMESDLCH